MMRESASPADIPFKPADTFEGCIGRLVAVMLEG